MSKEVERELWYMIMFMKTSQIQTYVNFSLTQFVWREEESTQ